MFFIYNECAIREGMLLKIKDDSIENAFDLSCFVIAEVTKTYSNGVEVNIKEEGYIFLTTRDLNRREPVTLITVKRSEDMYNGVKSRRPVEWITKRVPVDKEKK